MAAPWSLGAQVRINGKIHGQDCINVLHFASNEIESDVSPPSPLLTALVEAVLECVIETLLPAVTQDYTIVDVEGRFVYNAGGSPLGSDPVVATAPPASVGELGPTSVSFASSLVNLRSGVGGRSGRGKMFLPPPGESNITNSLMDSGTADLLVDFLTCMAGKFLGTSPTTVWRWVIFSRTLAGGTFSSWDVATFIVSQMTPVQRISVLARRKIGRGN